MTVPIFIHPQGTRIRIVRGDRPLDAATVGRTGLVVHLDAYRQGYYGIQLDGDSDIRVFAVDELEREGGDG